VLQANHMQYQMTARKIQIVTQYVYNAAIPLAIKSFRCSVLCLCLLPIAIQGRDAHDNLCIVTLRNQCVKSSVHKTTRLVDRSVSLGGTCDQLFKSSETAMLYPSQDDGNACISTFVLQQKPLSLLPKTAPVTLNAR
jgi:hypothetical protein